MRKINKVLKWDRNEDLLFSEDYHLNNNIAENISKKGFKEICKKYTHIIPNNIFDFLRINTDLWESFSGIGVDLGGGVGLLSSIVAKNDNVDHIYCIELTENSVYKCQPIIINEILGDKKNKVIPVIGDFDCIELKDSSVDFAIAWDSIHHSIDVIKTLNEAKRVVKSGGKIIIIDRAHNNSTLEEEIQRMLNVQYDKDFLRDNYLPEDKILTRKDNGEHEYRFNDWEFFFKQSMLKINIAMIVKEKCSKNYSYSNDAGIDEVFVDYSLGGFERKKIIYMLDVVK